MTTAQISIWLLLAGSPPDAHYVPGLAISYRATVDYWADANLVPRWLARKTAEVESGYVPTARSREWRKVGRVWRPGKVLARGLFQISVQYQSTHVRAAGMKHFDWKSPEDSARVGLALLRWLLDRYDRNPYLAVASFNAGFSRVESARPLPRETILHLQKVFP